MRRVLFASLGLALAMSCVARAEERVGPARLYIAVAHAHPEILAAEGEESTAQFVEHYMAGLRHASDEQGLTMTRLRIEAVTLEASRSPKACVAMLNDWDESSPQSAAVADQIDALIAEMIDGEARGAQAGPVLTESEASGLADAASGLLSEDEQAALQRYFKQPHPGKGETKAFCHYGLAYLRSVVDAGPTVAGAYTRSLGLASTEK